MFLAFVTMLEFYIELLINTRSAQTLSTNTHSVAQLTALVLHIDIWPVP